MNRLVDAVDVESATKSSGAASKHTVAERLAVDTINTLCSKFNAPNSSSIDDWNVVFNLC